MSNNSTKITKSVTLIPNSGSVVTDEGEIAYNNSTNKIEAFVDAAQVNLLSDSHSGNASITGNVTINGNETVTGAFAVSGAASIAGNSTLSNATVTGALAVTGTSTLAGAVSLNNLTATGNVNVEGNESITGTLSVTGNTSVVNLNVSGNESVTGTLSTTGSVTHQGAVTINNNLTATGNVAVSGRITTSSHLAASAISTPSSPAAGFYNIYPKTDNKLYLQDNSGNEYAIGSNAGSINYCTNPEADANTNGFTTYADGAAIPVDGGGGSPTLTFTRTTSSPLRGAASFLITPGALGNGTAYQFTLSRADYARMLKVSFDYEIGTPASYTDGDVGVYIISASDSGFTTNLEVVQCAPYKVLKAMGQETFETVFQSHASNQYYRICFHQITSATGYTLKIDNVLVGPQSVAYGAPVGDWKTYTPTYTGFGTVSTSEVYWRRVGSNLEIKGKFISGTSTGVEARVSLPSGLTSQDTTIIPTIIPCGTANRANGSNYVPLIEPSVTYITFGANDAANPYTKINGNQFGVASAYCSFHCFIPIAGWSSNVEVSSEASTRVVAFRGYMSGSPTVADSTFSDVPYNNKEYDTHGTFNTSNYTYTVPVAGYYRISAWLSTLGGSWSGTEQQRIVLYKNGSAVRTIYDVPQSSWNFPFISIATQINCIAGDTLKIVYRHTEGSTLSYNTSSSTENSFEIERISGPSQIAASEFVGVDYYGNGGETVTTASNIVWSTKLKDTHSAWSGTIFTAPTSGYYDFKGNIRWASANTSIHLYVNGTITRTFEWVASAPDTRKSFSGNYYLNAGDQASIRVGDGSRTLTNDTTDHWITINRLSK